MLVLVWHQFFPDTWNSNNCTVEKRLDFSFEFITEEVVSKLVRDIKISKSSAMGTLSTRLVKDVFQVRLCELTDIYNTCLDVGIFPISWGVGEITPIPKVGSHSNRMEQTNG